MVLAPPTPYYRVMPKKRPATNLAPAITALGRFVREQRDARGWSQDELAARAGANLTFTNISNIERGKVALPDPPAMIGIAGAFGVHVCDLYAEAGYPEFRDRIGGRSLPYAAEDGSTYDTAFQVHVTEDELLRLLALRQRVATAQEPPPRRMVLIRVLGDEPPPPPIEEAATG